LTKRGATCSAREELGTKRSNREYRSEAKEHLSEAKLLESVFVEPSTWRRDFLVKIHTLSKAEKCLEEDIH
jgi:hypothetical protein